MAYCFEYLSQDFICKITSYGATKITIVGAEHNLSLVINNAVGTAD